MLCKLCGLLLAWQAALQGLPLLRSLAKSNCANQKINRHCDPAQQAWQSPDYEEGKLPSLQYVIYHDLAIFQMMQCVWIAEYRSE